MGIFDRLRGKPEQEPGALYYFPVGGGKPRPVRQTGENGAAGATYSVPTDAGDTNVVKVFRAGLTPVIPDKRAARAAMNREIAKLASLGEGLVTANVSDHDARLHFPSVVSQGVVGWDEASGTPAYEMTRVPGTPLARCRDLLCDRTANMPNSFVTLVVAAKLLIPLAHLEAAKVPHGDLHYGNVLLDFDRTGDGNSVAAIRSAGIVDFGTSLPGGIARTSTYRPGGLAFAGSQYFNPPETYSERYRQKNGIARADASANMWSLGALLVWLRTCSFLQPAADCETGAYALEPWSLGQMPYDRPGDMEALNTLVERCLKGSPDERITAVSALRLVADALGISPA